MPATLSPPPAGAAVAAPQHGLGWSIVLHLGPGVAMLGFYLLTAPVVVAWGYPPLFAGIITIPVILVPYMIGYLALEARRRTGSLHLRGAIYLLAPLRLRQYLMWVPGLIAAGAAAFLALEALFGDALIRALAGWLPAWYLEPQSMEHLTAMPGTKLAIFLGSLILFAGVVAPVLEELYFRGNLLPALSRFGWWAPVIGTALFTLYHLESIWESPARFAMVLPMVLAVWYTRSVRLGIVVHVALNLLSALALTFAVLAVRG